MANVFTSCPFDDAGLSHYRARWCNAATGRFISEDPIGFDGGDANLQRYVGNDPGNNNDPRGLDEDEPINLDLNSEAVAQAIAELESRPNATAKDFYDLVKKYNNTLGSKPASRPAFPPNIAAGAGVGSVKYIEGKTAVRINDTDFYITGKPQPGMRVPSKGTTSSWFIYKKNAPNKMYRLDYDVLKNGLNKGEIGWEHNQDGVAKILKLEEMGIHNEVPAGPSGKLAGRAITVFKWGGRALFVVGMAQSGIDIYYAENKVREVVTQAGGWAGAWVGAELGGMRGAAIGTAIGATGAGVGAVPGAGIGGAIGALAGGVVGFAVGKRITTYVYDWIFTPLETEEWIIVCDSGDSTTQPATQSAN